MIKILFDALRRSLEKSKSNDHDQEEEKQHKNVIGDPSVSEIPRNNSNDGVTSDSEEVKLNDHQMDQDMKEFPAKIKSAEAVIGDINNVFTLEANDKEYFACVKDLPYQLIIGDFVIVSGDRDENGEFEVKDIKPKIKKEIEYGRVTALSIDGGYAVFEENTLLLFKTFKELNHALRMHAEFKYVAIESDQKFDGKIYDFRVINVIEKFNSRISGRGIIIRSEPFKIILNPYKTDKELIMSRWISVRNISEKSVDLMTIKATPLEENGEGIVELDMAGRIINFNISARNGMFKIFFRIKPTKIGTFNYKLTADFNDFKETRIFTVIISNSCVVPGPKLQRPVRFVDIRLGEYPIPEELKKIDFSKTNSAAEILSEKFKFLPANIDAENYLDKMRYGIYLEEIALEKAFANYRLQNVVFETSGDFLKLHIKDLAERRPSIVIGDKIIATDPHRLDLERPMYEGVISKIENESVKCKFHNEFHSSHHEKEFNIEFSFSRTIYKRQQHALDVFINEGLGINFLFPNNFKSKEPQVDASLREDGNLFVGNHPRRWYNNSLNKYQKNAVVNVLRGENRPLPYIFFGCPGSGKTRTVIETILQVHTHVMTSRIIVATPSNSAANLITEMLLNSNGVSTKKFIRLVSNNQVEKDLIPENISKYCATIDIASCDPQHTNGGSVIYEYERAKHTGIRSALSKNMILDYRIIIATLNCYGALLQMKLDDVFSHIFVDEAGQSIEPETLIPLTLLNKKNGQCILAGDPNQLGPISVSRFGQIFNFHSSMLERLLKHHPYYQRAFGNDGNEYDPKFVTKLKINYRALPSLLKVYNDLFYDGELESAVDEHHSVEALLMSNAESFLWKYTNKKCSVFFVNVDNGRNRKIQDSCSWYNDEEIRAIMSLLQKLQSSNIAFADIGIVTPYALQCKKIKHQIAVGTSETDLKVGTVEEFQGQERLIIIVSTVRTEEKFIGTDYKFGLGFLQCAKRMNVAISRPKALLVVFGKETLLKKDENWKKLITYTKENRTYVSDKF